MYNKRNCFRSIEPKLPPARTNRLLSGKSNEAPRGLDYSKQSAVKIIVDAARERSPSSAILFPWSGKMAGQNKELGMTLFTRLDCFKKRRRSSIAAGVPTGVTKKNWKNGKSRGRAKERKRGGFGKRTKRAGTATSRGIKRDIEEGEDFSVTSSTWRRGSRRIDGKWKKEEEIERKKEKSQEDSERSIVLLGRIKKHTRDRLFVILMKKPGDKGIVARTLHLLETCIECSL